jgi:CheY-like chemotaxis protein
MKVHSSPEHVNILIADDSALFRKLIEHTLTEECYSLLFARSGHEAIQLFEVNRPALVIVDWVMPEPHRHRDMPAHSIDSPRLLHLQHLSEHLSEFRSLT